MERDVQRRIGQGRISGLSAVCALVAVTLLRGGMALAAEVDKPVSNARPAELKVELTEALKQAIAQIDVSQLPYTAEARRAVEEQLRVVERTIAIGTENGDRWAKFLKLENVRQLLAEERPSFSAILSIETHMRQNYPGLERGEIVEFRERLRRWAMALKYGAAPERTEQVLKSRIDAAVQLIEEGAPFETDVYPALFRVVTYLHESGQASQALKQIRAYFARPNVDCIIPESFANRVVGREVDQPGPVDEYILGTHVVGKAFLTGTLSLDFLPANDAVCVDLRLIGHMDSINRGYNRGVVLRTTGSSPVEALATVCIQPHEAAITETSICTDLSTQIHAICHRLKCVRKIAARKAAKQQPLANAIAEQRMQRRIMTRFLGQIEDQLHDLNEQLQGPPRPELVRLGLGRPAFQLASHRDAARVDVIAAAEHQLAAPADPPFEAGDSEALTLRLHQSAVDNTLAILLAGRTIRNSDLDDIALQFGDEVPEEIQKEVDGDPWEITFADLHPVQLVFTDGKITVTLQIARMIGKERQVSNAIVTAVYRPDRSDDGHLTLVREGDLEIELPTVRSPTQATSLRGALRANFNDIFVERQVLEPVDLSDVLPEAPSLQITALDASSGWLQVQLR